MIESTARWVRRLVIGLVGVVVLLTGIALLVLPGPAFLVIPLGLGILSAEFAWARYVLRKLREKVSPSDARERSGADPP